MTKGAQVFIAILILVTLLVLGYLGVAVYQIVHYNRLTAETQAENISWSVKAISDESYKPHAEYDFKVNNQTYHGGTTLSLASYRNAWAAEEAIKQIAPQYKTVWYDPSDPAFSSLEKYFPTKQLIYAIILAVILNYFAWGGYFYIKNWMKTHSKSEKNDSASFKK